MNGEFFRDRGIRWQRYDEHPAAGEVRLRRGDGACGGLREKYAESEQAHDTIRVRAVRKVPRLCRVEQPDGVRRRHKIMEGLFDRLTCLPDEQVIAAVRTFAESERTAIADLVAALAVVEHRRLYLAEGASSLFSYCVDVLRLSPDAAYSREQAARAALQYPTILDDLRSGALSMTAIRLLSPVLTPDNYEDVLDSARFRTVREIERLVAGLAPADDGEPISRVTRLGPDRYLFEFTGDQHVRDNVREAQSLLRHTVPRGELGAIVERALDALLTNIGRARFARVARPRRSRLLKSGSRAIPAAVRRAVRERDGQRCAFIGREGRCAERSFLEFHHVVPHAEGGQATVDNIQLRCAAHNRYEAERWFNDVPIAENSSFQNE